MSHLEIYEKIFTTCCLKGRLEQEVLIISMAEVFAMAIFMSGG
jgi:hypothetical protein